MNHYVSSFFIPVLEKTKKELELVLPSLFLKYNKEEYLTKDSIFFMVISNMDIEMITKILEKNLETLYNVRDFYEWLGEKTEWIYSGKFNQQFNASKFWKAYRDNGMGAQFLYRVLWETLSQKK